MDLVGPLPALEDYMFLFTVINRTTPWAEAILLHAITTVDCVRALLSGWVACFSVPAILISDRGTQITFWCGRPYACCSTAIKAVQATTVPLTDPLPDAQLSLATEASDSHIGGVLQ